MHISKDKTDQFFSGKLKEHTKAPRQEAWLKLEEKLQQKQRKIVPIWQRNAFAASIVLLILGSITAYFYNTDKPDISNQLANNTVNKPILPNQNTVIESVEVARLPETVVSNLKVKIETKNLKKKVRANNFYPQITQNEHLEIAKITEKTQLTAVKTDQQKEGVIENLADNNNSQITNNEPIDNKIAKIEDLTVVVTLANYEPEKTISPIGSTEMEKKSGFLSRLFKQLMNAKNGDRVEWNEIGIKPAKIWARAEEKLKTTSEGINNTYQTTKNKTI
jgi:hypothetical protein